MRRLPFLLCALTLLAAPASAPAAGPGTGGSTTPSSSGGVTYGQPLRKLRRARRVSSRPVAREFTVAPAVLEVGHPATFAFRVDGRMRSVRVRIEFTSAGARAPVKRLRLGYRRTGTRHEYVCTPATGELPAGDYSVTLKAFDDAGNRLRRTARASGRARVTVQVPPPAPVGSGGAFPVQGVYSFGGADARFGADRARHICGRGSIGFESRDEYQPSGQISKCRCGPEEEPVLPTRANCAPAARTAPLATIPEPAIRCMNTRSRPSVARITT